MRSIPLFLAAACLACSPLRLPTLAESHGYDRFGGLGRVSRYKTDSDGNNRCSLAEWQARLEQARDGGWFETLDADPERQRHLTARGFKRGPYESITWWFGPQVTGPVDRWNARASFGYVVAFAEIREKGPDLKGDARLLIGRTSTDSPGLGSFAGVIHLPDGRRFLAFAGEYLFSDRELFLVEDGKLAGLLSQSSEPEDLVAAGAKFDTASSLLDGLRAAAKEGPDVGAAFAREQGLETIAGAGWDEDFSRRVREIVGKSESDAERAIVSLERDLALAMDSKSQTVVLAAVKSALRTLAELDRCCAARTADLREHARTKLEAIADLTSQRATEHDAKSLHLAAGIEWLIVASVREGRPVEVDVASAFEGKIDTPTQRAQRAFARALVATGLIERRTGDAGADDVIHLGRTGAGAPNLEKLVGLRSARDARPLLEREGHVLTFTFDALQDDMAVKQGEEFKTASVMRPGPVDNPKHEAWKREVDLQERIIQGALYDKQVYGGWTGTTTERTERRIDANTVEVTEKQVAAKTWLSDDMGAEAANAASRERKARVRLDELLANPEPEKVVKPMLQSAYTLVKEQRITGGLARRVTWRLGDRSGELVRTESLSRVNDRTEAEPAIGQQRHDRWMDDKALAKHREAGRQRLDESIERAIAERVSAERRRLVDEHLGSLSQATAQERADERARFEEWILGPATAK